MKNLLCLSLTLSLFICAANLNAKKDDYKDIAGYTKLKQDLLFGTSKKRLAVIDAIIKAKDYYPLLEQVLKSEDNNEILKKAIDAASVLKLTDYAPLIQKLLQKQNEPSLTLYAVNSLGELGYKDAQDDIIALIKEKQSKTLSIQIIRALGAIKSEKAIKVFYTIFKESKDSDIKYEVIKSLGLIQNADALPFLKELLNNKSTDANLKAILISSIAQCKGGFKDIAKYARDSDTNIAITSINSLNLISSKSKEEKNNIFKIAFNALRHDNEKFRYAGLNAMGSLDNLDNENNDKAIDIVTYIAFNDDVYNIRKKAIVVLSKMGGSNIKSLWKNKLTKTHDDQLKVEIIETLSEMDKNDALYLLKLAFKKSSSLQIKKKLMEEFFEVDEDQALLFTKKHIMDKSDNNIALKLYNVMLFYKKMSPDKRIKALTHYLSAKNMHIRRYAYNFLLVINNAKSRELVFNRLKKEENTEVILHILSLLYQKKIKESLPFLEASLIKSDSLAVRKETKRLISFLKS